MQRRTNASLEFLQRLVFRLVAPDGGAEHITGVRIDGVVIVDEYPT
jgi:hypothetical protein